MKKFVFAILCEIDHEKEAWTNIGYLVSSLNKLKKLNVSVEFFDLNDVATAIETIKDISPDFIGLSILQFNLISSLNFIREAKKCLNNSYIIIGNVLPSVHSIEIMTDCPEIDCTVIGEGENTIVDLCECILNNKSLENCNGIAYRNGSEIIKNNLREPVKDLDTLPYPDRSHCNDGKFGFYSIIASRGCDGHCTFCDANTIYRHTNCSSGVRYRSIENVVDEIEVLQKNNNAKKIYFVDSTFGDENRLDILNKCLLNRKIIIPMKMNLRCDLISDNYCNKLRDLARIGLSHIILGIESGNNEDLKLYNKMSDVDQNKTALENLKHLYDTSIPDIFLQIGFINFNPYSTIDKLISNVEFLRNYHLLNFRTINTRLSLTPSQPIAKKVMRDLLLKQDLNYSFVDGYAYNFAFNNIEKLYNILQYISHIVKPILYDTIYYFINYIRLYSNISVYEKDMLVLYEYNNFVGEIIYNLFYEIVNMITKDENFIKEIVNEKFLNYINQLNTYKTQLNIFGKKLAKIYFSI